MSRAFPAFTPVAEHSLLVEFGEVVDEAVIARVHAFDRALNAAPFDGFLESVPAYAATLIRFDPLTCDHGLAAREARARVGEAGAAPAPTLHEVPVCYDPDLAPDLVAVAEACGLAAEAVIAAHLSGDYGVAMYGFAPGYAYLSGVPRPVHLPRKPGPVRGVPAGTVLIAGPQCLVSTLTMPTGWWRIGASSARILTGDPARPFLFDPGDRVRFRRITRAEFERAG